ncbi:hypothetical protein HYN59_10775 [Flavobacterium album]|uniref:DUF1579 domain-containing protein n=1 Tax=Flavobacterium album TaxID=2175091 RepID=A0A2S1QYW5_9FLAO|nr:DUF1579 domain-containing protein [Flavobacterium album]AWH85564.1 hypothetical protein HYN59_10775 [Flavobacterium album]
MKKVLLSMAVLALCLASCKKETKTETETDVTAKTDSVTPAEEVAPEKPMDSVAMQEAWKKYATPGSGQKMMADEVGTWNCEMTFWMEPNGKPEKSTSVAEIKMVLGGRYQEATYKGTMMGQPFEGKSTMAYNNANNEITSTFIDNMGTGMMVSTGTYDEATKAINLRGEMVDCTTGKKRPYREAYTMVDANTRTMEMFDTKDGKEYKSMEIVMKRK